MDSQAIYNAVCNSLRNCDVGSAVERVCRDSFDISHQVAIIAQEFSITANEQRRPCVLFRPRVFLDGNLWCALYGDNLQDGVAGFGDTPNDAMRAFDLAWTKGKP